LHEIVLQRFKGAANLLLGHLGQLHDLTERARDPVATTSEEEAACDEGILSLSLEEATLICILEQMLAGV
jgi:hypothetical protein